MIRKEIALAAIAMVIAGCDEPVQVTNPPEEALKVEIVPSAKDKADEVAYRKFNTGEVRRLSPNQSKIASELLDAEFQRERLRRQLGDPDKSGEIEATIRELDAEIEELKNQLEIAKGSG